ncbi:EMC3/TMCO1 family protein [Nanoarchaeota archaeon]
MSKKQGSFKLIIWIMIISLAIAFFWDTIPFVKNAVHSVLDPSAGALLQWDLDWGMAILVLLIAILTTLIQKYTTDQVALKELKKTQKAVQEEMKKFKHMPDKMMELQKKQMAAIPETFKLSSRSMVYTGVPFILLFRWFMDVFELLGDPKIFGFFGWIWFYLIFVMVFSGFLRKYLKVA